MSSPSGVRGGAQAANELVHIEDLKTHLVASMNKQSKTLKMTVGLHDNNV